MISHATFEEPRRSSVLLVGVSGCDWLTGEAACPEKVGYKAHGLVGLPSDWVPPFFVIDARTVPSVEDLLRAAAQVGISAAARVYVRSSGTAEGLAERGMLESADCEFDRLRQTLESLRARHEGNQRHTVHWLIQAWKKPRAKGHLSNERRVSRKARDWIAEIEPTPGSPGEFAPVAVRRWREAGTQEGPIHCDLRASIPRALRIPAAWAGSQRAHMEWVWDGTRVYVVQFDAAKPTLGVHPRKLVADAAISWSADALTHFRIVTPEDLARYRKLANVKLYTDLGHKLPSFYILDDQVLLKLACAGNPPASLVADLEALCAAPFVLRTDGLAVDSDVRQMLPRSDELRSARTALEWLSGSFASKLGSLDPELAQLVLIGHHFLPAAVSAWCLAFPDERRVRIEALWGIPEGLYYYSHDAFDVDTGRADPSGVTLATTRTIRRKVSFKDQFVAPDANGQWVIHRCAEGPDWSCCIAKEEWLHEIAITSRRIAEKEGKATVVMWFIDIPPSRSVQRLLPWYHEEWTERQNSTFRTAPRKNAVAHEARVLTNEEDLLRLLKDSKSGSPIGYVTVAPVDGAIVRERNFIERLAADAKLHGYEVQLSGGVLSHVFYALTRHGCAVSCIGLFEQEDETVQYNKLVRDRIPEGISGKGESVEIVSLEGEALLAALKRKAVEEVFEVYDARTTDAIAEEIADLLEVLTSLMGTLGLSNDAVKRIQKTKKDRRGGFDKGLMLLRTHLPPPGYDAPDEMLGAERRFTRAEELPHPEDTHNIDRRINVNGRAEYQVKLAVPVSIGHIGPRGHSINLPTRDGSSHPIRIELSSSRVNSEIRLKIALSNDAEQLNLFSEKSPGDD